VVAPARAHASGDGHEPADIPRPSWVGASYSVMQERNLFAGQAF
jgi:hypothetical protein